MMKSVNTTELAQAMNKRTLAEYRAWKGMKARCNSPSRNVGTYKNLGITVCAEWVNSYEKFYEDMGDRPSSKHSLDRIDNSKGYSRENCRWATQKTQCSNRGDFNKVFAHNGEEMHLKAWAEKLGIKYTTLYQRIYRTGMSFEQAISIPVNFRFKSISKGN